MLTPREPGCEAQVSVPLDSEGKSVVAEFGDFRLNLRTGELSRRGIRLRFPEQQLCVLKMLLAKPGELVTREELRLSLWSNDTFVDFENGLNAAVNRLRETLSDTAKEPRFVETVPRRGYRFIAELKFLEAAALPMIQLPTPLPLALDQQRLPAGKNEGESSERTDRLESRVQRRWRLWLAGAALAALVVLLLAAAAAYGLYTFLHRGGAAMPFRNFSIVQVTLSGEVTQVAISPDGKFILSVKKVRGAESLWLRNIPTGSDTQVIPPTDTAYRALAFSPGGNYIYFRKAANKGRSIWNLYRAPLLGGTPSVVVKDIDSNITFFSGGERMAYVRLNDPELGKWRLLSANPDGSDEKVLLIEPGTSMPLSVAWSPDGKRIACSFLLSGNAVGTIDMFDLASGHLQSFVKFDREVPDEMAWLPNGRGLLTVYYNLNLGPLPSRSQIGFVPYPAGSFRTITNDTNVYSTLTLSANAETLATIQVQISREIDLLPTTGTGRPVAVPGIPQREALGGFSWDGDSHLLVSEGNHRIVRISPDGSNPVTILSEPSALIADPSACAEGGYIVFARAVRASGYVPQIWRTDHDGSNLKQLTEGKGFNFFACSPDGRWVYYVDTLSASPSLLRTSVEGGTAQWMRGSAVANSIPGGFAISPDGKMAAYIANIAKPVKRTLSEKLALVNLAANGKTPPSLLDVDWRVINIPLQFTPNGQAVAYGIEDKGVQNIWVEPIDGSKGRQITNFTAGKITSFAWSPDGKRLAVARSHSTSDVVLLHTSRP